MRKELVLPVTAAVSGAAGFSCAAGSWPPLSRRIPDCPYRECPPPGPLSPCPRRRCWRWPCCAGAATGTFPGGYDAAFSARGRTLYMAGMVAAAFLMVIAGALFLMELPQLYAEAKLHTQATPCWGVLPRALLAVLALCSGWSLFQLGKNNYRGEGQGKYSPASSFRPIPPASGSSWPIRPAPGPCHPRLRLSALCRHRRRCWAPILWRALASSGPRPFGAPSSPCAPCTSSWSRWPIPTSQASWPCIWPFFLYFAASSAVLLYNARQPRGPANATGSGFGGY